MKTIQDIENLIANLRAAPELFNEVDDGGWPVTPDLAVCNEAADMIERMASWLEGDCNCPCCLGVEQCRPGCTFAEDAPSEAERMADVRDVMFGERTAP